MSTSTHPISCLTRTDAEISTCYHSFFLIRALVGDTTANKNTESGTGHSSTMEVVARIPTQRYQIEHVESGLTIFIASIINSPALDRGEASGTFLLTSSDGSRYYAFWNGLKSNIFVAISRFPHFSFSRQVISVLAQQSMIMMMHEEGPFWGIRDMLLTLCETPILPTCGVRYELQFDETSVAQLEFNSSEQISDVDSIMIVLSIFTPDMLLSAWESVMLERKVLVVSTNTSIIAPCCDFIRRLVLPLNVVNTYVPLLPAQLINAIEAPFPYLIGAETGAVIDSEIPIDLSHIVVIDLDQRRAMMPPTSSENPDVCAPPGLVHVLLKEVNDIMMKPYSDWISRAATTNNHSHNNHRQHPFVPRSTSSLCMQADALLQLFIRTNLSLISARDCTVKAFFRRLELHERGTFHFLHTLNSLVHLTSERGNFHYFPKTLSNPHLSYTPFSMLSSPPFLDTFCYLFIGLYCPEVYKQSIPRPTGPLGFDLRFGVAYGCMQLLRLRKESTDTILHFLTCWVELDESALAVYEHADELPLLYINTKDIQAVSPSAMEPEGHVFEIITTQLVTSTYKLIATDFESRRQVSFSHFFYFFYPKKTHNDHLIAHLITSLSLPCLLYFFASLFFRLSLFFFLLSLSSMANQWITLIEEIRQRNDREAVATQVCFFYSCVFICILKPYHMCFATLSPAPSTAQDLSTNSCIVIVLSTIITRDLHRHPPRYRPIVVSTIVATLIPIVRITIIIVPTVEKTTSIPLSTTTTTATTTTTTAIIQERIQTFRKLLCIIWGETIGLGPIRLRMQPMLTITIAFFIKERQPSWLQPQGNNSLLLYIVLQTNCSNLGTNIILIHY